MRSKDRQMLDMYRALVRQFDKVIVAGGFMHVPPTPPTLGVMEKLLKRIEDLDELVKVHEYRRKMQKMADFLRMEAVEYYNTTLHRVVITPYRFRGHPIYLSSLFDNGKVPKRYDPGLPFLGD